MEYDYRLLSQEEVFGDAKTDVIKTTGAECAVSDFAVVSGAYISDGRTCMWFLSSSSDYGDVCAVDRDGSSRMAYPDSRGGMRPVMECADISQLDCSTARDISGFEEVEYGEYPQSAADRELAGVLEQEFSEGRLIKTGKRYCSQYDEFQHEGGKYIRALYIPEKTQQLSNGKKYSSGDIVWLKVSPLKWLYDAKAGLLISRTIPAAGLRFSHGKYYDGDFEKTDMCRYLNTTFADDIVPVVLRELTPEEKARIKIDQWFADAGWKVVNREDYEPTCTAVAIREGLLKGNLEADYFLFINGKAVGVLEAKREETDAFASEVCEQAALYARSVPNIYQAYQKPLPFIFTSNGKELYCCDFREQDSCFRQIMNIPTPHELVKRLGIEDAFAGLPTLKKKGLRDCQYEAVTELEKSFRAGQNRALMVLATGVGKTYTACLAAYRMLSYTPMRRVLFLVDRNNLGKQAEGEFGTFRLTENGEAFNTIFTVNRLRSSSIPSDSNVVISTIQRLFSFLKGETIEDNDDDENEPIEEVTLPPNPNLPHDYFDMIIIDECHRSIYGNWRKVLEYFDTARLVGLTATPIPETMAFFNNNCIVNYTLEKSIVDGVNVDCRVYRIKTQVTETGGAILEGEKFKEETRYTGEVKIVSSKETKIYTNKELNRSIINPAQIKLVLSTYRDVVYTELFNDPQREPNMDFLPKTLIFALNEAHATNIVQIAKEVFGRTDDRFVQKITYSAGDSNELIRQFRNDKDFRIAVTCTLVATGTDVKPLEVVMFMRDVESLPLYIQMKGRGVRTIGDEQLRNVTPNAFSKDCFYLVDAVGVTEHAQTVAPIDDAPTTKTITLKELLERISHGYIPDEYLKRLAATLARIYNKADDPQRKEFVRLSHDDMKELSARIYDALEKGILPPFVSTDEPNNERKGLVAPLANHADARKYLLILAAGFVNTLMPGEDTLISKGFSIEEAKNTTEAFEDFCKKYYDEIEALRIIYNNEGEPITYSMLKDLENRLKMANNHFTSKQLWNSYAIVNPKVVRRSITKEESDALTNIIQLVRFAFHQIERLDSVVTTSKQFFNLWLGQNQREITDKQREVISRIVDYIASNGACTIRDIREDDATHAAQMIRAFGNMQKADEALHSLYTFVVLRKAA